jgi:hypothetical protein
MLSAILVILIILWVLGYLPVMGLTIPNIVFFTINNQPITLWNVLVFLIVIWAIEILPRPFREIAMVLLVVWVLSVIGIIAVSGLSNLLVIAIIFGLFVSIASSRRL